MNSILSELSFFDCNVFIGKHQNPYLISPFELRMLEKVIKKTGIMGCLVYHSASVLYDAEYGNRRLIEEASERHNFYPVWIAIPELCTNKKDAELFLSQIVKHKVSAIKIFPRWHNYNILTKALDNLFLLMDKEKIPLLVNQEEILWEEILYILKSFKNLPLLLNSVGYRMERYLTPLFYEYKNFYLDISRFQVHGGVEHICKQFSSERILFGSGMPIYSPEPIIMMLSKAKITLSEKQNISMNNLMRLLNRD